MKELKFRAWNETRKEYCYSSSWDHLSAFFSQFEQVCLFEQFIGRCDCRKEELYDGDLLKDGAGNVGIVEWNEEDCSFNVRFDNEYQPLDYSVEEWGLKIGNIHENANILNG